MSWEVSQNQAPIYEALVKLRKKRIVPFDVPVTSVDEEIQNLSNY